MSKLMTPEGYRAVLDLKQTELGIKRVKDFFLSSLSTELRLRRVTAPLFVLRGLGINDDLNGVERAVSFPIRDMNEATAEVVHSLAKWKRVTLADYRVETGFGIVTDMNAIRADEELDNIHSLYVDQWDWERVMRPEDRNIHYLKCIVNKIYSAILRTEFFICETFPALTHFLPEEIHFIHSEELLQMYPNCTPKEREDLICRKYGAVFIMGIGGKLSDGTEHDLRAPDYDDWSTANEDGYHGLNGDLLVWYPLLKRSIELSSMGIRVDVESMNRQLDLQGKGERRQLYFHRRLLEGSLPQSIGGGIGQSRLCMILLHKAHIGETQSSIWPDAMRRECRENGITLI
ncbi:MAG: aspartate--ammonia ligase [Bacteroidaceae bacterium]|nr:aspartate--ammonia ligase [Bacteroidaceae bacterium]